MRFTDLTFLLFIVSSFGLKLHLSEGIFARQNIQPGSPEYECHANCGGVIQASNTTGYCDTDQFKTELTDCLQCALTYDIWKYYGSGVTQAAQGCGLNSTPLPAASNSTSTSELSSTSQTSTAVLTTSATSSVPASTTASSGTSSSVAVATSTGLANNIGMDKILAFAPMLAALVI